MIRNMLYVVFMSTVLMAFAEKSYSLDFNSLDGQDSYRCSQGIVAIGNLARTVREKCGDPLEIKWKQDVGPVWIYYQEQATLMYYLEFTNEKLQRIMSAPCSPDDSNCLDLEF